jgi:hypothetical protein
LQYIQILIKYFDVIKFQIKNCIQHQSLYIWCQGLHGSNRMVGTTYAKHHVHMHTKNVGLKLGIASIIRSEWK